jgi:hypothetical protein
MATDGHFDYLEALGIAVVVGAILLACVALFMLAAN